MLEHSEVTEIAQMAEVAEVAEITEITEITWIAEMSQIAQIAQISPDARPGPTIEGLSEERPRIRRRYACTHARTTEKARAPEAAQTGFYTPRA